jgi:signal transduction histidine kinase
LSIAAWRDGGLATILVADDGPGILPERLEEVLSRGGRLDETGNGAGLEAELSVPI